MRRSQRRSSASPEKKQSIPPKDAGRQAALVLGGCGLTPFHLAYSSSSSISPQSPRRLLKSSLKAFRLDSHSGGQYRRIRSYDCVSSRPQVGSMPRSRMRANRPGRRPTVRGVERWIRNMHIQALAC